MSEEEKRLQELKITIGIIGGLIIWATLLAIYFKL